jgi:hypothetical protein
VVVDILDQCVNVGELHHALEQEIIRPEDIHGEIVAIVAGTMPFYFVSSPFPRFFILCHVIVLPTAKFLKSDPGPMSMTGLSHIYSFRITAFFRNGL